MITLHLGQPKTGTSVLQRALVLKSEEVDDLHYPKTFRKPGYGHHVLAQALRAPADFLEIEPDLRALLADKLRRDVVFSSEQFANMIGARHRATFDRFAKVCAEYGDLQGVIYIRRFDDFFNSMMLQSMRYGGFRGSPEEYVFSRLNGIRSIFAALREMRNHPDLAFHIEAYSQGFNILESFQEICPRAVGLDQVGPLPRTEKFTWKQQIFIAAAPKLFGAPLSRDNMELMIKQMRDENIQLEGDLTNYCVIPEDLDRAVRDAANAAAREQGISEYSDAFGDNGRPEKNYVPFTRDVLSNQDIEIMAQLCNQTWT